MEACLCLDQEGPSFKTGCSLLYLWSLSVSQAWMPGWGRRQKPLLPSSMDGSASPCGETFENHVHQQGTLKIHCTNKDQVSQRLLITSNCVYSVTFLHFVLWIHPVRWVCLWLHLRNVCELKCSVVFCWECCSHGAQSFKCSVRGVSCAWG